jgi:hypothetical protein
VITTNTEYDIVPILIKTEIKLKNGQRKSLTTLNHAINTRQRGKYNYEADYIHRGNLFWNNKRYKNIFFTIF